MPERMDHEFMADEMDKIVYSKSTWLATFDHGPKKRPDHEIETKRRELEVLKQAASDYRAAAQRSAA